MISTADPWVIYTIGLISAQLIWDRLRAPQESKVNQVAKAALSAAPIIASAALSADGKVDDTVNSIASKTFSAASAVFRYGWNNLSWTGRILGGLGLAYLLSRCTSSSGVTVNNNNDVKVIVNINGSPATFSTTKNGNTLTVDVAPPGSRLPKKRSIPITKHV